MNKFSLYIIILSAVTGALLSSNSLLAQNTQQAFGKNRIQHRTFTWKYYATANFDIYYYDEGARNAKQIAEFIEEDYQRITDIIGFAPYAKTKIFIYNSHVDLLQSNVGLKDQKYDIGGQTNFLKTHIEVAFPGEMTKLREELTFKIAELFIEDMMYGGLITEVFQGNVFFNLPEWYILGAAAYIAYGWSAEMDDKMRDLLKYKPLKKVKNFSNEDAMLAGQSIWNYMALQYGKVNISNVLNLTRIIRNEEKSFMNTLGIRFDYFISQWIDFYLNIAEDTDQNYIAPSELPVITQFSSSVNSSDIKISPNGKHIAYTQNKGGKYAVFIKNLETNKTEKIFKDGYKVIDQKHDPRLPIIDWGDSTTLGIISPKNGIQLLWIYNIQTKELTRKDLRRFNQVTHLNIYPNGKLAVMSVDIAGQNDLYLVSTISPTVRRLTNDAADNITPYFIPGTKKIVFSSNRPTDSLQSKFTYKDLKSNYNLYVYDIDSSRFVLNRLTNDVGRNYHPVVKDQETVYYLSDKIGISNVFKLDMNSGISSQITNFSIGINTFDISNNKDFAIYNIMDRGKQNLFYQKGFGEIPGIFKPSTIRQQTLLARGHFTSLTEKAGKREEKSSPISEEPFDPDSLLHSGDYDDEALLDLDEIDFEPEVDQNQESSGGARSSLLESIRKLRSKSDVFGPLDYEEKFVADNVITSWMVDPIIGFAPLLEYQMNDLMENHRFIGGFMVGTDFNSGRIFGEYQYLGQRWDYKIAYNRTVYNFNTGNIWTQKFNMDQFKIGIAYPFSSRIRWEFNPHFTLTRFVDSDPLLLTQNREPQKAPLSLHSFVGAETGFVYDNSSTFTNNRIEGTQAKLMFRNYNNISGHGLSFNNLFLDIRNYQPIIGQITFATRLFYGNFFGQSAPRYMLGAVDNWIAFNNRIANQNAPDSPLRVEPSLTSGFTSPNLMFHEFVTNLRGFNFNKFNGTQAAVFNAELRVPLINPEKSSVSSNFVRNLKLVGFFDIGSGWSGGRTPWDRENSINSEKISSGTFDATVRNFKNPWLYSYGAGVRTVLFGYYIKVDYAYPVEDNIVGSPRIFLSLGQDF